MIEVKKESLIYYIKSRIDSLKSCEESVCEIHDDIEKMIKDISYHSSRLEMEALLRAVERGIFDNET